MGRKPQGDVTFLFTDIEGSTRLWELYPASMWQSFAEHERIVRESCTRHAGFVYKMIGDAFQVAFATTWQALQAALEIQRGLAAAAWGETGPLRVRMAIHTGATQERGDDYVGPLLNQLARMLDAGHGGQILLSEECARAVPATEGELRDLGIYHLRDIARPTRVFQVVAPGLAAGFPPLKAARADMAALQPPPPAGPASAPASAARQAASRLPGQRLPTPLSSLIGRHDECAAIRQLVRDPHVRLITLVGAGGIGKTRVALAVAAALRAEESPAPWWVDLTPLSEAAQVLPAIATAFGLHQGAISDILENLQTRLSQEPVCLLLDNAEHLLDAGPDLSQLLQGAESLTILVTSRARLDLYGEYVVPIQPLSLPSDPAQVSVAGYQPRGAMELFLARAGAAGSVQALTPALFPSVYAICRQLDGLPLAIELAAAHSRDLPLADIEARLVARLDFLANGPRGTATRQQTLRALLNWTYALLPPPARRLLGQLAVFRQGWTRQTLTAVCPDHDPDTFRRLLDYHLVTAQPEPGGDLRYTMLETVHAYALERLATHADAVETRERHAEAMLRLLSRSVAVDDPGQPAGPFPEAEYHNCVAALQWWHSAGNGEGMLALAAALWPWWQQRFDWNEGYFWCERVLAATATHASVKRAALLFGAARLGFYWGMESQSGNWISEAAALLEAHDGHLALKAEVFNLMAVIQTNFHAFDQARESYQRSLALWERLDRQTDIARIQHNLGLLARDEGDFAEAEQRFRASLDYFQGAGDHRRCAIILGNLSSALLLQGRVAEARRYATEGIGLARQEPTLSFIYNLFYLMNAVMADGDEAATLATLEEIGQVLSEQLGLGHLEWMLRLQGQWWAEHGPPAEAITLLGASESIVSQVLSGHRVATSDRKGINVALERLRAIVGDEAYERAWRLSQSFDPQGALRYARGLLARPVDTD